MSAFARCGCARGGFLRSLVRFHEGGRLAEREGLLGRGRGEQMHGPGDGAGPSGLVARAEAGPVVAVEVLVEQDEIAPVRILLELLAPPIYGSPTILAADEDGGEAVRDVGGHLIQVHPTAGAR